MGWLKNITKLILYGQWQEEIHMVHMNWEKNSELVSRLQSQGSEIRWALPEERQSNIAEGFQIAYFKVKPWQARRWKIERSDCATLLKRQIKKSIP
jgi:hypothetical protein